MTKQVRTGVSSMQNAIHDLCLNRLFFLNHWAIHPFLTSTLSSYNAYSVMAKPKKRSNKGRPGSRLMPQQQYARPPLDQETHPTTASPFQPLNMFFNRSRNARYAAIPEVATERDPSPPYFSRPEGEGGAFDNNVLINMGNYDDENHSHNGTSSTGTNTLNNNSKASTPPLHLYSSDADTAGSRQDSIEEDVCFPAVDEKNDQTGIDFDALEEFIQEEQRNNHNDHHPRRRRLSNMLSETRKFGSVYGDRIKHQQEDPDLYRITYYSPSEPSTIHARSISEIPSNGDQLSSMIKKGCFWIDVLCPTDAEMKAFSKVK
ncbi:hypothetical protein BJV82DRAFT_133558 [Fennellomyces sp. T-0311]|nr:hypothetical protein BJV82DRAFT_133558 [Fennellomyces sp. T-0311]